MTKVLAAVAVMGMAAMGCAATEAPKEEANVTVESGVETKCTQLYGCPDGEEPSACFESCESPGPGYVLEDECTCSWSMPGNCYSGWSCTWTSRRTTCGFNYRGQYVCG